MLTDSVVLRKYLHLKGKFVSPANIALVNQHSESKIIWLNSCSMPGAGSLCETVRTSWGPPQALMLGENVKGGGFSYAACATGTLDPSGCREAPRSPTLWGSSGSDSLYVSKVQLKSAFPPRWGLLVKTSCPHSTACLHHAQPRGPAPRPSPEGPRILPTQPQQSRLTASRRVVLPWRPWAPPSTRASSGLRSARSPILKMPGQAVSFSPERFSSLQPVGPG